MFHVNAETRESTVQPSIGEPTALTDGSSSRPPSGDAARRLLFGLLAIVPLIWVALYNGYPTVFSDTGSYLITGAFLTALMPYRAPGYSMFTRFTTLGFSAWPIVLAQAAIVVYVLAKVCNFAVGGRRFPNALFAAAVGLLAALTSLPWFVSVIMPDIFAGVVFLAAFLLAYDASLRLRERACLAAILAFAVSAHMSLLPVAVLLTAALSGMKMIEPKAAGRVSIRLALAWLIVPLIASGLWTATLNWETGIGFGPTPSGNFFLLARLFGNGLASDFLHKRCPDPSLVACRYVDDLPKTQEEFAFVHPLLGEMRQHPAEMDEIVRGALAAYPFQFVAKGAGETLRQLVTFRTGDEIRTYGAREWNADAVKRVLPGESEAFLRSRQSRNALEPVANLFASIHTVVFWLSLAGCLAFAWKAPASHASQLFYAACAFLIVNALVCASFSGVWDRYQSRVVWLAPFCLAVQCICWLQERVPRGWAGA